MKTLYDKSDRDYYIFFEKGEIQKLLLGETVSCFLYSRNDQGIAYPRQTFIVSVLETYIDVFRKNQELTESSPKISYGYADVLVIYGTQEEPCTLILSKEWITVGLSDELLNRCGKNEQRYSGGCKVHFYSEDSTHFTTEQMRIVFDMEERAWQRDYGDITTNE